MTTPPLDLNALKARRLTAEAPYLRDDVLALIARVEHLEMKRKKYNAAIAGADAAEAKVAAVRGLTDHYAALADSMPKPHGTVTRTQAIFVRDIHQALDTHTPETETTP